MHGEAISKVPAQRARSFLDQELLAFLAFGFELNQPLRRQPTPGPGFTVGTAILRIGLLTLCRMSPTVSGTTAFLRSLVAWNRSGACRFLPVFPEALGVPFRSCR